MYVFVYVSVCMFLCMFFECFDIQCTAITIPFKGAFMVFRLYFFNAAQIAQSIIFKWVGQLGLPGQQERNAALMYLLNESCIYTAQSYIHNMTLYAELYLLFRVRVP